MHDTRSAPMMQQPAGLAAAARGAMAGPQGPTARGARILSPRMGGPAPEPPPDVFSNLTPGADSMLQPLENIQTDPTSLRALTAKLDLLSPEVGQTWRHGVELLLAQPPGPRDAIQKLQTYFGLKPVEIDVCAKMINIRRVDIGVHDAAQRRNRTLAVAALGLYGKAQAEAILATEKTDQKLYRTCNHRLRDEMAKGSLHAQLVLNFMKTGRPMATRF
jgi:hypothetical protein